MPFYDYKCGKCNGVFEVEKPMKASHPKTCPLCKKKGGVEHVINSPSITYADRPAWTYNDFKHYQTSSHNGGPRFKMEPGRTGDLAAWDNPGELVPPTREDLEKSKKKKDILKKGGYMSDAKKAVRGE